LILDADVEIGGTDQLFNMLVGRALQKDAGKSEQAVITMPLLVGLDGTKKMSKSADNYIAFTDAPKDMFGKIMSIDDATMWTYHQLLLETPEDAIDAMKQEHPMQIKKNLAKSLVSRFYSEEIAEKELAQFEQVFSKNKIPDDMPTFKWEALSENTEEDLITNIMHRTKLFESKGAIRRLIAQGGVKVNGEKITDPQKAIKLIEDDQVIQAGKRIFFKLLKK
jgi:tyrosyl-tRNA synthetase